jgi:transcriptional regulator with XRE-family HTH domain
MGKKRGPKTKYNDERGEAFVRLARAGKTAAEIAEALRVSRKTLTNWMRRNPELLLAVRSARKLADGVVEAALFQRATGYSHKAVKIFCSKEGLVTQVPYVEHYAPDTQAAMFWLRNRQPKRWREKSDGTDVNVRVNNYAQMSDEQLDARLAELEQRRAPAAELAPAAEDSAADPGAEPAPEANE